MKNVQWQKKCLGHKHWGSNKFCRVFGEDDTSNHTIKKLGYNKSKHSLKHIGLYVPTTILVTLSPYSEINQHKQ